MAKSAAELADVIAELEAKDKQRAYEMLRTKCIAATEDMIKDRAYDCTVQVEEREISALEQVTEELRTLGYKFRFIERQRSSGETVDYSLLISIHHCK
jgi:hypothetical protein